VCELEGPTPILKMSNTLRNMGASATGAAGLRLRSSYKLDSISTLGLGPAENGVKRRFQSA
jgi:hypothetical protein